MLIGSLVLLVPLVMFMRRWDERHLNLLQKCLLVSILVHMLLLVGFTFKKVVGDLPRVAGELGITHVTVTLDASTAEKQEAIGEAIRQQSSSDLPAALAPAGKLDRGNPGEEVVAAPESVRVNVPRAAASDPPMAAEAPPTQD